MLINGKLLQGLFLYDEDVTFTVGDLVVEKNSIYVCTADEVAGLLPSENPNSFDDYLSSRITTLDEYFNYLNNPDTSLDKYVSANVISGILNTYMFGFDEKGTIVEYISDVEGDVILSPGLESIIELTNLGENLLNQIIISKKLNNLVIKVSRSFFPDLPSEEGSDVVLRQYSYESEGTNYRVQEVVDPINSIVLFRAARGTDYSQITSWKSSSAGIDFQKRIDSVINYYTMKIEELNLLRANITTNYRYASYPINNPGVEVSIPILGINNSNIISVGVEILAYSGINLRKISNVQVYLDDVSAANGSAINYFVSEEVVLTVRIVGDYLNLSTTIGSKIVDLTYRKFYEDN